MNSKKIHTYILRIFHTTLTSLFLCLGIFFFIDPEKFHVSIFFIFSFLVSLVLGGCFCIGIYFIKKILQRGNVRLSQIYSSIRQSFLFVLFSLGIYGMYIFSVLNITTVGIFFGIIFLMEITFQIYENRS